MELILLSFAVMKGTDFLKELIPFVTRPWEKSAASLVLAVGLTSFAGQGGTLGIKGLGVWGLAAMFHELQAIGSLGGDFLKTAVIMRASSRRR